MPEQRDRRRDISASDSDRRCFDSSRTLAIEIDGQQLGRVFLEAVSQRPSWIETRISGVSR